MNYSYLSTSVWRKEICFSAAYVNGGDLSTDRSSTLSDAISIIGPGFAGAIIALFNTNIAFIGDSISFFIAACCLLMIRR